MRERSPCQSTLACLYTLGRAVSLIGSGLVSKSSLKDLVRVSTGVFLDRHFREILTTRMGSTVSLCRTGVPTAASASTSSLPLARPAERKPVPFLLEFCCTEFMKSGLAFRFRESAKFQYSSTRGFESENFSETQTLFTVTNLCSRC